MYFILYAKNIHLWRYSSLKKKKYVTQNLSQMLNNVWRIGEEWTHQAPSITTGAKQVIFPGGGLFVIEISNIIH